MSVANAIAVEGDDALFQVTLSPADPANEVTVDYETSAGTALDTEDYEGETGTVVFAPGETVRTIAVPTVEDERNEATETFEVTLTGSTGAELGDANATGTITDDDPEPEISIIAGDDVLEGDPGDTPTAEFTVALSAESGRTITVDVATAPGTATEDLDYTHTTETLTFLPGETNFLFSVPVDADDLTEGDETFDAELTNVSNATIGDGLATVTILDDDDDPTGDADLRLTKFDFDDPVPTGGDLNYEIHVLNEGPHPAAGIQVTDDLPAGVTLLTATPSGGGSCNSADPVVCTWPSLGVFFSASVVIEATAPGTPGTLTNTASVTSTSTDPNLANNTASEETEVREQRRPDAHEDRVTRPGRAR